MLAPPASSTYQANGLAVWHRHRTQHSLPLNCYQQKQNRSKVSNYFARLIYLYIISPCGFLSKGPENGPPILVIEMEFSQKYYVCSQPRSIRYLTSWSHGNEMHVIDSFKTIHRVIRALRLNGWLSLCDSHYFIGIRDGGFQVPTLLPNMEVIISLAWHIYQNELVSSTINYQIAYSEDWCTRKLRVKAW